MNKTSKPSCNKRVNSGRNRPPGRTTRHRFPYRRRGLSLIEVVAALTLVGTLLVGIVMARARHTHQAALAERKLLAVQAVDELLLRWYTPSSSGGNQPEADKRVLSINAPQSRIPLDSTGSFDSAPALSWRTELVSDPVNEQALERFKLGVVRLTVTDDQAGPEADPLLVIDLAAPAEQEQAGQRTEEAAP